MEKEIVFKPLYGWYLQLIILFYLSCIAGILIFTLWIFGETDQTIEESLQAALMTSWILLPFSLVIIIFGPIGIMRRKIVKKVRIIKAQELLTIEFTYKGVTHSFVNDEFSYSFDRTRYSTTVIIYRRFINSRGYLIDDEFLSIVGLRYGFGWNDKILSRLHSSLMSDNIAQVESSSRKNILNRLMKL